MFLRILYLTGSSSLARLSVTNSVHVSAPKGAERQCLFCENSAFRLSACVYSFSMTTGAYCPDPGSLSVGLPCVKEELYRCGPVGKLHKRDKLNSSKHPGDWLSDTQGLLCSPWRYCRGLRNTSPALRPGQCCFIQKIMINQYRVPGVK